MPIIYILLICFIWSTDLIAKPLKLFKVTDLSLETTQIEAKRDPYFVNHDDENTPWLFGVASNWSVLVLNTAYFTNTFHFDYDDQVRHAGWKYEIGVHLNEHFDIFKFHHSQHMLEMEREDVRFPVDDRYGVRINFITK